MMNITYLPSSYTVFFIMAVVGVFIWWAIDSIRARKHDKKILRYFSLPRGKMFLSLLLLGFNFSLFVDLLIVQQYSFFILAIFVLLTLLNVVVICEVCKNTRISCFVYAENHIIILCMFLLFLSYSADSLGLNAYKEHTTFIGTKCTSILNLLISAIIIYLSGKLFPSKKEIMQDNEQSTGENKIYFPIVYKKGCEFEVLPELILDRKDEVWGYEILPNLILSRKYVTEDISGLYIGDLVRTYKLNGEYCDLPNKTTLMEIWSKELRGRIQQMDNLLYINGLDGDEGDCGTVWCYDNARFDLPLFCFSNGSASLESRATQARRIAIYVQ